MLLVKYKKQTEYFWKFCSHRVQAYYKEIFK